MVTFLKLCKDLPGVSLWGLLFRLVFFTAINFAQVSGQVFLLLGDTVQI